jgi:hypothetical protein
LEEILQEKYSHLWYLEDSTKLRILPTEPAQLGETETRDV